MSEYTGLRYLHPEEVALSRNPEGGLRAIIGGTEVHEFVRVYRVSPISMPNGYVSLRSGHTKASQKEIGIIADTDGLAPADKALMDEELGKRYYSSTLMQILGVKREFGLLYFSVVTDRGPASFALAEWMHGNIRENGQQGRVIADINGSRFIVPTLSDLDDKSLALWRRYIYWETE